MQLLQNYCKNFCKILQESAITVTNYSKILERVVLFPKFLRELCVFLQNFCKSCVFFCKIFVRVVFSLDESLPQCFCYRSKSVCIPLPKCKRKLTVDSEPRFSRQFRKRQEWSYPKGRDEVILEKMVDFVFLFRQIKPLQNIWFQKNPYPWCFWTRFITKHVIALHITLKR